MLIEGIPFERLWKTWRGETLATRAIISFVQFMERRLGAQFVYDVRQFHSGNPELADLYELAAKLQTNGVLRSFGVRREFHDEPPFSNWYAECCTPDRHVAGGMAINDNRRALTAALAEALERYIWFSENDYYDSPFTATVRNAQKRARIISPDRFAGFSPTQRETNPRLTLHEDAEYLWIKGQSHTQPGALWVPAQIVSGKHGIENVRTKDSEPIILEIITTGLATGPTDEWALLGGALEILERDAFMITWLNQLTPPRIPLAALAERSVELSKLLAMCTKYRLRPTIVSLPTDAPTFAVCAIVHDDSGVGPQVTVGLRAGQNLADVARGAVLEALRIRLTIRYRERHSKFDKEKPGAHVVHLERADYWAIKDRYKVLDFLLAGPEKMPPGPWEHDGDAAHLARIVEWCRSSGYEFTSVDVGRSKHNPTKWKIRSVVIPECIPLHQNEHLIYTHGARLTEVPKRFGYKARPQPFTEEPHPFA